MRLAALVRNTWLSLSAIALTLAACEIGLRLLPVSTATLTGYGIDPMLLTYPPGHRWTVSTGWDLRNVQHLQANNMGFAADRDFVADPNAVALIGDSFVEASMLPTADRPAAQLEAALHGRPVYAMGGPGSSLLDYAERIRWAVRRFGVRDVVVLMERGDVRQSICGSGNVHAACLDAKTSAPRIDTLPEGGTAKRWARRSALAQYVVSQLKLSPAALWRTALDQSRPPSPPVTSAASMAHVPASAEALGRVDAITDRFFDRIEGQPAGRLVIVLDSDRTRLLQHQPVDDPERERFIARARAHGAVVVDTQPLYGAHFAQSPLRLDVGPYDAHLNPLGVRLAMGEAAKALVDSGR